MKRWKIVRFAKFMDQKRTFESLEMTNKLLWNLEPKIYWERERDVGDITQNNNGRIRLTQKINRK